MGTMPKLKKGTTLLTGPIRSDKNTSVGTSYMVAGGARALGEVLQGRGALKASGLSYAEEMAAAHQERLDAEDDLKAYQAAALAARGAAQAQVVAHGIVGGSPMEAVLEGHRQAHLAAAKNYETRYAESYAAERQARATMRAGENTMTGSMLRVVGTGAGTWNDWMMAVAPNGWGGKRGTKPLNTKPLNPKPKKTDG